MLVAILFLAQLFGITQAYPNPKPSTPYMFIGGFNNTQGKSASPSQKEGDTEAVETAIGRNYAFQLHYYGLNSKSPITYAHVFSDPTVLGDLTHERMPWFSWTCGGPLTNYTNGTYDTYIDNAAFALSQLKVPVGLRFFHEFNLCLTASKCANGDNPGCFAAGNTDAQNGAEFVAAWEHIWNRFQADGVTNVAFVWCPNGSYQDVAAHDLFLWLPPLQYVDWIGFDVYDKGDPIGSGSIGLVQTITPFYTYIEPGTGKTFPGQGKPMILDETGEVNNNIAPWTQAQYFADLATNAQANFPALHGFSYFSSHPSTYNWILDTLGTSSLATTASEPYFDVFGY
jgi:hypothetical protein